MALVAESWGMDLLVVGKTPLAPMQIEQAIGEAAPLLEPSIESFEDYLQAYDHCKKNRSVGLIFVLEESLGLPILDTFQNLARPFEESKGPCFGVIIHSGTETLPGSSAIRFSRGRLIDYCSVSTFEDPIAVREFLRTLWRAYSSAVEETLLPEALTATISSVLEKDLDFATQRFLRRASQLITSRLRVSWWDSLAIQWFPVMDVLRRQQPRLWEALTPLKNLTDSLALEEPLGSIDQVLGNQELNLSLRAAHLLSTFAHSPSTDSVQRVLLEISAAATPGSAGLLRQISKISEAILTFAKERDLERTGTRIAA